jgi:DNA-directed RNA polymerase specialized sigma24 family protein
MLELLSDDEKAVLRAQLDGDSVEQWAQARGVSRATAYRMMARVKALCRVNFDNRSSRTQLAVLDALREQL